MNTSSWWIRLGNRVLYKSILERFISPGDIISRVAVFNRLHRYNSSEVDKAKQNRYDGKVTIFDKIINREIPADIIYEDEVCMAFNDVNPQAPTHFLVIPKKRIARLNDAESTDQAILGHLIFTATKLAKSRLTNGFRLGKLSRLLVRNARETAKTQLNQSILAYLNFSNKELLLKRF